MCMQLACLKHQSIRKWCTVNESWCASTEDMAFLDLNHPTTKPWRTNQEMRSQTDQVRLVGSCYFPYIYGKVPHPLEMCCLTCVASAHALDMLHISPPHCRTTWCAETQHKPRVTIHVCSYRLLGEHCHDNVCMCEHGHGEHYTSKNTDSIKTQNWLKNSIDSIETHKWQCLLHDKVSWPRMDRFLLKAERSKQPRYQQQTSNTQLAPANSLAHTHTHTCCSAWRQMKESGLVKNYADHWMHQDVMCQNS